MNRHADYMNAPEFPENKNNRPKFDIPPTPDLSNNQVVTKPIGRIDEPRRKGGKQKKYTPRKIKVAINKYFADCEKQDRVPSVKGLMLYLKLSPFVYYKYANEYPEFKDIIDQARLVILEWCESDVYRTGGTAAGKISYMKNVHDWTDKISQNTNQTTKIVYSVEEAQAKIAAIAPTLLQALAQSTLLQQQLLPSNTNVIEAVEVK